MSNYKIFALVLISMGGICMLTGNLFLILIGIIMAGIGIYTALTGSKDKKFERISAYSHQEDKETKSELADEKLPIDEKKVETVRAGEHRKSEFGDDQAGEKKAYKSLGEMPPEARDKPEPPPDSSDSE